MYSFENRYNSIVGFATAFDRYLDDEELERIYAGLHCEVPAFYFPKKSICQKGGEEMVTLLEVAQNATPFVKHRVPKSKTDFGDTATIGLRLKSASKEFKSYTDHDFGVYLGFYKGQFHVGTQEVCSFVPSKLASYPSLQKLKEKWILD